MVHPSGDYRQLATYRQCTERITAQWGRFQAMRADRLRHGSEVERVAETILDDLFTEVLDWSKGDVLYQQDRADIVLSQNGMKYLVIEAKRPGLLRPNIRSLKAAIQQARGYADAQKIARIAASDGCVFYAADIVHGAEVDRTLIDLSQPTPPQDLWWLSVHGIYRTCSEHITWPADEVPAPLTATDGSPLLHPKYKLPARCFAYVGNANDPQTWKLPYLELNGSINERWLPKAIQALLSNYRGAKVGGIPEPAIPAVLLSLARAADLEGRMPPRAINPAPIYSELADALRQLSISVGT